MIKESAATRSMGLGRTPPRLIESDSMTDRLIGEKACGVRRLGFEASALATDRAEKLKRLRPCSALLLFRDLMKQRTIPLADQLIRRFKTTFTGLPE
jgi:hypothetical protein